MPWFDHDRTCLWPLAKSSLWRISQGRRHHADAWSACPWLWMSCALQAPGNLNSDDVMLTTDARHTHRKLGLRISHGVSNRIHWRSATLLQTGVPTGSANRTMHPGSLSLAIDKLLIRFHEHTAANSNPLARERGDRRRYSEDA